MIWVLLLLLLVGTVADIAGGYWLSMRVTRTQRALVQLASRMDPTLDGTLRREISDLLDPGRAGSHREV